MAKKDDEPTPEATEPDDDVEPPPDTNWVKSVQIKRIMVDDRIRNDE